MVIFRILKNLVVIFCFYVVVETREKDDKIGSRLTDKAYRVVAQCFGEVGEDDGEQLHLRAGRVTFIVYHRMRIQLSQLPCTLQCRGGGVEWDKDLNVKADVTGVDDVEVPLHDDIKVPSKDDTEVPNEVDIRLFVHTYGKSLEGQ